MKPTTLILLLTTFLRLGSVRGAEPQSDPLAGAFFPPELIVQGHEKIGMNQEQLEAFRARIDKAQPQFEEFRQRLGRESAALAALAKPDHVDEAKLSAQLDKVLDAERDVKHFQIGLLAAIKNQLTPEQQARLRELTKDGNAKLAEEMRQRLTAKVERVQTGVRKLTESGRNPSEIGAAMAEKVKPLLDAGKVIAAEAELDRLIDQLGDK